MLLLLMLLPVLRQVRVQLSAAHEISGPRSLGMQRSRPLEPADKAAAFTAAVPSHLNDNTGRWALRVAVEPTRVAAAGCACPGLTVARWCARWTHSTNYAVLEAQLAANVRCRHPLCKRGRAV